MYGGGWTDVVCWPVAGVDWRRQAPPNGEHLHSTQYTVQKNRLTLIVLSGLAILHLPPPRESSKFRSRNCLFSAPTLFIFLISAPALTQIILNKYNTN